jgi:hypothetical protein
MYNQIQTKYKQKNTTKYDPQIHKSNTHNSKFL